MAKGSTADFNGIDDILKDLKIRLSEEEFDKILMDAAAIMYVSIISNFTNEGNVKEKDIFNPISGKDHWTPLKPKTIKRRLKLKYGESPILFNTGKLVLSLKVVNKDHVTGITSDVIYAKTMNYGNPKKNIPPRPYLHISKEAFTKMEKLIFDRLMKNIRTGQ